MQALTCLWMVRSGVSFVWKTVVQMGQLIIEEVWEDEDSLSFLPLFPPPSSLSLEGEGDEGEDISGRLAGGACFGGCAH